MMTEKCSSSNEVFTSSQPIANSISPNPKGARPLLQVLRRSAFLGCKDGALAILYSDLLTSMAGGLGALPEAADGDQVL